MVQTAWLAAVLAGTCAVAGLFHLVRAVGRQAGAVGELAHVAMCAGMAAMFLPAADPLPRTAWLVAFLAIGAWFAAAALRRGPGVREAGHHVVCAGAMVFMLLAHGSAVAGHAHHGALAAGGPVTLVLTGAALLLAAYFVAHAVRHLTSPACAAPGATGAVTVLDRVATARAEPVTHVVMGAAMAVMLLGAAAS